MQLVNVTVELRKPGKLPPGLYIHIYICLCVCVHVWNHYSLSQSNLKVGDSWLHSIAGRTEIPFEIPLKGRPDVPLYETYHGVFVNIQVEMMSDF